MTMALLLSIALAFPAGSAAKSKPRSGASLAGFDFTACVEKAVLGSNEGECAAHPESEPCVGLRRALENSQKHVTCAKSQNGRCLSWSFHGKTEDHWISIAAGHLANFGICIRKRYGSDDETGLEAARGDARLVNFLKKIDDGGEAFQLTGSAILLGALDGKKFSRIIQESPFAKEHTPHELHLLKEAADTPSSLAVQRETEAFEDASNPAAEGESFVDLAKALDQAGESSGAQVLETISAPGRRTKLKKAKESFYRLRSARTPKSEARAPSSYGLGLDRTLFERVNSAYQRQAPGLRGMEEYLRAYPPSPPADYSDLLKRGGTL
jgi:hypothetical protein